MRDARLKEIWSQ